MMRRASIFFFLLPLALVASEQQINTLMEADPSFTNYCQQKLISQGFTEEETLDLAPSHTLQMGGEAAAIWSCLPEEEEATKLDPLPLLSTDTAFIETTDPKINAIAQNLLLESFEEGVIQRPSSDSEIEAGLGQAAGAYTPLGGSFPFDQDPTAKKLWSVQDPITEDVRKGLRFDGTLSDSEELAAIENTAEEIADNVLAQSANLSLSFTKESDEESLFFQKHQDLFSKLYAIEAPIPQEKESLGQTKPLLEEQKKNIVLGGTSRNGDAYCGVDTSDSFPVAMDSPFTPEDKKTFVDSEEIIHFLPIDEILHYHCCKMKREARLFWKGSRGMFDHPVRHLVMDYEHCHALDEQQARRVLVYAVESLLNDLNPGERVHPQLSHGPFLPEDLTITIHFNSFFGRFVDSTYVKYISLENGVVCFEAFNCCGPRGCWTRSERYKDSVFHVMCELEGECLCNSAACARNHGYGVAKSMRWEDNALHAQLQERVTKKMPSSFQRYPILVDCCDSDEEQKTDMESQARRKRPFYQR